MSLLRETKKVMSEVGGSPIKQKVNLKAKNWALQALAKTITSASPEADSIRKIPIQNLRGNGSGKRKN